MMPIEMASPSKTGFIASIAVTMTFSWFESKPRSS